MSLLLRYLIIILVCLSGYAHANTQLAIDDARQRLESLTGDESDPAIKQLKETHQKTLTAYQETLQLEERANQFRADLEVIPKSINQLEKQLATKKPINGKTKLNKLSVAELEQQLTLAKAKLLELEQTKDQLEQQTGKSDEKLISLREQLSQIQQQVTTDITDNHLKDALFSLKAAKTQALELEILALPGQSELRRLELQGINQDLKNQSLHITALQDIQQAKRKLETELTLNKLQAEQQKASSHPVIRNQLDENQSLSEKLRDTLANTEETIKKRRLLDDQLAIIRQSYLTVQQQLELSTKPLGVELRKFTRRLSKPVDIENTRNDINQLRLLNLEITRALFQEVEISDDVQETLQKNESKELLSLLTEQQSLLQRLREATNQGIDELSQLLSIKEQINRQIRLGRELISQHLLWIPSIHPVSVEWPAEIMMGSKQLYQSLSPQNDRPAFYPLQAWIPELGLLLILTILAYATYVRYKENNTRWHQQIGNVVHDRFSHTFSLLWMPLLICLPLPAALLIFFHDMLDASVWNTVPIRLIGDFLASTLWLYMALYFWLSPTNGILTQHLDVPERLATTLRRLTHPLFWLGTPLISVLLIVDQTDNNDVRSGIGRMAFIVLTITVTLFWAALWKVAPQINQVTRGQSWWQSSKLWLSGLVGIHLIIILAALLGYVFTGSIIMVALSILVAILFTTFLFFKLGNRWLLIEERRLAFDRARTRRNEILEAREKNEEVPPLEENYIDLQSISDQARVLLKAATVILFVSLVWLLLKNAMPTLNILDKVVLWSSEVATTEGLVTQAITLKQVLFGVALITMLVLAAYNLPGLLELLVLRHINLSTGTSYAITSVTKYVLLAISILAGAAQLGLEWSKLQWLVAALGVGLGFGLQEIVANFVSGLIILFEKPVRIGDTVTIGGYTGTVTRIQIRATTIADWDRKEVIIPNKNFVTDQLINWSLSDPITRVVIKVGVAYGSDTEKARDILLNAAIEHPKVLRDPAPEAYFLTFGGSTLDLELRLYVSGLADRLSVTHEINQHIDKAFKEQEIEIAFPQLDIHLHRSHKS